MPQFPCAKEHSREGGFMAPIFAAFPAEFSGGWRLHCFHLCQLQRARGQGEGSWERGREDAALCILLLREVVVKPLLMPNPSPGLPHLFWGAKIQSWRSQLCFRVPNPSLPCRMRLFSGGTCGGMGMVTGTPSTPAAPSWPGTSGVRDATSVTRGGTGLEGGRRGWEPTNTLDNWEKDPQYPCRIRQGHRGMGTDRVHVLVRSSGE